MRYQNLTRKPELFRALELGPPRPGIGYDVLPKPPSLRPCVVVNGLIFCYELLRILH